MLEDDLRKETEKWLNKLEKLEIKPLNKKGEEFLVNIKAYISDCKHFLKKEDYIRSFEAIIWSWSWVTIGKEMGILIYSEKK